jgi:hypothetical protein
MDTPAAENICTSCHTCPVVLGLTVNVFVTVCELDSVIVRVVLVLAVKLVLSFVDMTSKSALTSNPMVTANS